VNGVGAATTEVHVLRSKPTVADPRYVRYALLTKPFLEEGVSRFQGVAGLQRVPEDFVRDFRVNDRPLDEQRRIADFLDDQVARIDKAIAGRRGQEQVALRGNESAAFHGVTATAIRTRRPSPDLPWSATLPSEWPVAKLSLVAQMGSGHTPSRSEPDYWIDCDIPWLTTSDVHRFRVDEIETIDTTTLEVSRLGLANSAAVLHPAGTVALSRTASAGFSIVMGPDMATSQDFVTWTCGPRLEPYYLLWCLRAMRRDLLERLAMGSTHKTIYFPDLQALRVPLPPLAEQASVVEMIRERVGDFHQLRAAVSRQIGLLEERKRSLITAAVTGELDESSASPRAARAVVGG
jgi:type I restriction enzyme S subunit